ncbi:MAG: TonB-dependent receptor plug domain-containing protein [Cytophagales bacterium]
MKKPLLSCLALSASLAIAQEIDKVGGIESDSTLNVFELSLEDLMNVSVTVASKKAEKLSDAPGAITAYTDKDMERLGYYTLADLANITAGYSAFKGIGETTFETRGQQQSGFDNNKHLVLIDGIPYNHARANMALGEENLPLFFAQRVEFLKGPGSALYGTSAFFGVINVVGKEMQENGTKVESKISAGNHDFNRRVMSNIYHKSDNGVSRLSFGYFGKDASNDYLGNGTFTNANALNRDNSTSLFMNGSHKITKGSLKGLGSGFIYSRKTGGLGEFWMFYQNQNSIINNLTWEQIVPYVKYEREINNKLTVNSYLKGNLSTENAYTQGYQQVINPAYGTLTGSHYNVRVLDGEFLGEGRYKLAEKTNLIGGVNVVSRHYT